MTQTQYTRQQLITFLAADYASMIADDFDADNDLTADQYLEWLHTLADDELATI